MIIVYYKSKLTGEFSSVRTMRPGATMDGIAPHIAKYNEQDHHTTCGAVEVAEDSLEAYLFKTRNLRADIDREALQDAIESMEDALHNMRFLRARA